MPGDNGYYPPIGYSGMWPLIAVGILVLIAAWYLFVWLFPRPKKVARSVQRPIPGDLVARYQGLIDDIERAHASGELQTRAAHQKLSVLVRAFAEERSGAPISAMTLADLDEANLTGLAETVRSYYPAEFAPETSGGLAHALQRARQVVVPWS
ncbi:hypothetical protein ACSAGD_08375 [Paramicrobacterium sp. CJ85]|uniref:hypothetical protein n=1 Tax=Paramicrobacterium sp. CJ85 TaxID=3445355 RepID=UPI003F611117